MKPYSINLEYIPFWSPASNYEYYNNFQLEAIEVTRKQHAATLSKIQDSTKHFSTLHAHISPLDASRIIQDVSEKSLACKFNEYYKICFTRNPWARIYSLWKMLKIQNRILKNFTDFVCSLDEFLLLEAHPVIRYTIQGTKSFVSDTRGNIMVDKIFKLEDTTEFTDYMAEKYNIPRKRYTHSNSRIANFSSYKSQYNLKTIKIIESRYQWEIENFGYKF